MKKKKKCLCAIATENWQSVKKGIVSEGQIMKTHEWFWSVLLGVVVVGVLIYCQYAKAEIERIGQDISDMRTVVEALTSYCDY